MTGGLRSICLCCLDMAHPKSESSEAVQKISKAKKDKRKREEDEIELPKQKKHKKNKTGFPDPQEDSSLSDQASKGCLSSPGPKRTHRHDFESEQHWHMRFIGFANHPSGSFPKLDRTGLLETSGRTQ